MCRRALFFAVAVGLLGTRARAEPARVVVVPFETRCFDAARLAERVRAHLAEALVTLAPSARGAFQEVRVGVDGAALVVRVTAKDAAGRTVASEMRELPAEAECATLLETTELIVVRAATPLHWRDAVRARPPHAPAPVVTPRPAAMPPPAPTPPLPLPQTPPVPLPQTPPVLPPTTTAPTPPAPTAATPVTLAPAPAPKAAPATTPAVRVAAGRAARARFELGLDAAWSFPLDGPPSAPIGNLTLGVRWSQRLGLALRVGVSGEWTADIASSVGRASVSARRVPLALELGIDLRVRGGAIRLGVGPMLSLWLVAGKGVAHADSTVAADPGAFVRAAYRLELGRFVLEAGLHLDVAFVVDNLTISGLGTVAHTPVVDVAPFLGAGVRL